MYEFTSKVRYSECGMDSRMTPTALVTRMQDCSCFQSESIGKGPLTWFESHETWIIIGWQVRIYNMPKVSSNITTATWPYEFKGSRGYRNFTVRDENGELCAAANSTWVFFDLNEKKPARVPEDEMAGFGLEPKLEDFEYAPRRIDLPDVNVREEAPFRATVPDVDMNQHVNNLKYIDMARSYVPAELKLKELRVQYVHECKLGEMLFPKLAETEHSYFVSLNNSAGQPCAIVEFITE